MNDADNPVNIPKDPATPEEIFESAAPAPVADPVVVQSTAPSPTDGAEVAQGIPSELPPLREYAAEIATHTRRLEALVDGKLGKREDGNLSRAKAFLHEAGQWLEKAAQNLKAAGV